MHNTSQKSATSPTRGNSTLAWVFLAIAAMANIAGYVFNLYNAFWWFDEILHAYTIFAVTLVLALYAYDAVLTGARTHTFLLILAMAALGIALGALWEVAEWAYDQLRAPNVILGKTDTIIDLIVDTGGALTAGWVATRMVNEG